MTKAEFAQIYEEFFPQLYRYIFYRVQDVWIAEDLISQVFFKALKNLEKYDTTKGKISTWLYTIASHTLIDHFRTEKEMECIEGYEDHEFYDDNTHEKINFEMDLEKVRGVLQKLPVKTQEIITLRIFEELSFVEIAKIMGIGESGAKMSFSRGIETIKNSFHIILLFILFCLK